MAWFGDPLHVLDPPAKALISLPTSGQRAPNFLVLRSVVSELQDRVTALEVAVARIERIEAREALTASGITGDAAVASLLYRSHVRDGDGKTAAAEAVVASLEALMAVDGSRSHQMDRGGFNKTSADEEVDGSPAAANLSAKHGEASVSSNGGVGVHTRAGDGAEPYIRSAIYLGSRELLDSLVGAGLVCRCLGCGQIMNVETVRVGSGKGRVRGRRVFCDSVCRHLWESKTGKSWGGCKAVGLQKKGKLAYRAGVYLLYRSMVGRSWLSLRGIRELGILGDWFYEVGVSSNPMRLKRLLGIMLGLGLLECRLENVRRGFARHEWRILEPLVGELLE